MRDDPPMALGVMHIVIPSDPMAVRAGLMSLLDSLMFRDLGEDDRGTAEIVLAEALNNIVEHAYAQNSGDIELTLSLNGAGLCCRIVDHGLPMPGEDLPRGQLSAPQNLPEGGFGWHLIRTLSQDLEYRRVEGRNQLSFRLETAQSAA